MRAVVQRVSSASISVDNKMINEIENGFLVLLGVEAGDNEQDANYIAAKLSKLRVFEDENGKMNLNVQDINGAILLISQFTLLGDTRGQNRPSFITAARPDEADKLYIYIKDKLSEQGIVTKTGVFGAHMQVALINDGPVTILIDSKKIF